MTDALGRWGPGASVVRSLSSPTLSSPGTSPSKLAYRAKDTTLRLQPLSESG